MISTPLRSFLALTLATPAWASTWIVDDNGGPGVDFTTISAAVAVAVPRDVILVRAGIYGGFTLSEGVLVLGDPMVLGQGGVVVTGPIHVTNVGPGPRATIAGLLTHTILVQNCTAAVTIENVIARANGIEIGTFGMNATMAIVDCADVRLRDVQVISELTTGAAEDGLHVDSSRVEITHSLLRGADGLSGQDWQPDFAGTSGGDGLSVTGPSDVHVSLSSALGGTGGDTNWTEWGTYEAGDGGHGIHVTGSQANLIVTGTPADQIRGAPGGCTTVIWCSYDGSPGSGVVTGGSSARLSGATIQGSQTMCGCQTNPSPPVVGVYTNPIPEDPSLAVSGTIAQGQSVTLTLRGAPGSAARLRLGRQAVVQDVPEVAEDRMTIPLRTYDLGTLPPSGQATFQIVLSNALTLGSVLIAQASTTSPTSGTTLTQSVTITVY